MTDNQLAAIEKMIYSNDVELQRLGKEMFDSQCNYWTPTSGIGFHSVDGHNDEMYVIKARLKVYKRRLHNKNEEDYD